ncbi:hypothetical protein [Staphylococcus cohnii]
MDYFYNNPSFRKALETYKKQIEYINNIPKSHINNLISTANYAKKLSESNSLIIENVINSRQGVFNSISIANSVNFKRNLFSEEALNSFIQASSFPKDEILKMNYALRNFNVNIATTSTFTESIDSSHPIDEPKNNGYTDEFKRIMDNHVVTPSKELINVSSKTIFVETIADFVLRLAHQDPVNTSVYIWVLFFSYFGYLTSKDNDDIKTNH